MLGQSSGEHIHEWLKDSHCKNRNQHDSVGYRVYDAKMFCVLRGTCAKTNGSLFLQFNSHLQRASGRQTVPPRATKPILQGMS